MNIELGVFFKALVNVPALKEKGKKKIFVFFSKLLPDTLSLSPQVRRPLLDAVHHPQCRCPCAAAARKAQISSFTPFVG